MTFYRSGIKATLFSDLLHCIALVIKPIRIFKSIQFLAGIIAVFLFFLLFRFFFIDLFGNDISCGNDFFNDLFNRRNRFRIRLFLIFKVLVTGGKRELFHGSGDVVHIRIHCIVPHENGGRNRRTQDQPVQGAASAQRHIGLARRKCGVHIDDGLVERKSLALVHGYSPRSLQRILLETAYLFG